VIASQASAAQQNWTQFFVKAAHIFVVHFPSTRKPFVYPYHTPEGRICLKLDDFFFLTAAQLPVTSPLFFLGA